MLPSIEFTADSSVSLSIVVGVAMINLSQIKDKKRGEISPPLMKQ